MLKQSKYSQDFDKYMYIYKALKNFVFSFFSMQDKKKIYSSVFGTNKKSIGPVAIKVWYKTDIWHSLSDGKVHIALPYFINVLSHIKIVINVAVNGFLMSSNEIELVGRTTYLYTSPKLGYHHTEGVIRDVTVTNSNDMDDIGEGNTDIFIGSNRSPRSHYIRSSLHFSLALCPP